MSLRDFLPRETTITMTLKEYENALAEVYKKGQSWQKLIVKTKIETIYEALDDRSANLIADGDMGSEQLVFIENLKEKLGDYLDA